MTTGVFSRHLLIGGAKRSGSTLLNRLFDSCPGVFDMPRDCYFWEHAYNYRQCGHEEVFLGLMRTYAPEQIVQAFLDRELLPCLDGKYVQMGAVKAFVKDIGFDTKLFESLIGGLKDCATTGQAWDHLLAAYARALPGDNLGHEATLHKCISYGRGILAMRDCLADSRCIFILRNPFHALDSLVRHREMRGAKHLNAVNMAEVVRDYLFFWDNRERILAANTLLVRFEDLLSDPEAVMRTVAGHMGLEYDPILVEPTLRGEPWGGFSTVRETRGIDDRMLDYTVTHLSAQDVDFVAGALKPLLDHYDYTL